MLGTRPEIFPLVNDSGIMDNLTNGGSNVLVCSLYKYWLSLRLRVYMLLISILIFHDQLPFGLVVQLVEQQ